MKVEEIKGENTLILKISGKIDTAAGKEFLEVITKSFQKTNYIEINFKDVEYISSFGLRALMIGQKTALSKGGSMKVTNVKEHIMEIFSMTGMEKILTLE